VNEKVSNNRLIYLQEERYHAKILLKTLEEDFKKETLMTEIQKIFSGSVFSRSFIYGNFTEPKAVELSKEINQILVNQTFKDIKITDSALDIKTKVTKTDA
jgi:hypothetical protein